MSDLIDLTNGTGTSDAPEAALSSPALPPVRLATPLIPTTPLVTTRPAFLEYPLLVTLDSSYDNNPFDQVQHIANTFDDPFESVHTMAMTIPASRDNHLRSDSSTATLIQLDEQLVNSPVANSSTSETKRKRDASDNVVSSDNNATPSPKNLSGPTAATARRTQLLKYSIANAAASQQTAHQSLSTDVTSQPSTPDKVGRPSTPSGPRWMSLGTDGFDDLMSTSPGCLVDSDEPDDSCDLEQLSIPFLKLQPDDEKTDEQADTAAAVDDVPDSVLRPRLLQSSGGGHINPHILERLERCKAASAAAQSAAVQSAVAKSPAAMPVLMEELDDNPIDVIGSRSAADRQHLVSLLASVKQEIERFDDHSDVRALLQSALDMTSPSSQSLQSTSSCSGDNGPPDAADVQPVPKPPVVREGTFTFEDDLESQQVR